MVYVSGKSVSLEAVKARFAPVLRVVENKYYFDEVYQWVVDRVVLVFSDLHRLSSTGLWLTTLGVNGPANSIRRLGYDASPSRNRPRVQLRAGHGVGHRWDWLSSGGCGPL